MTVIRHKLPHSAICACKHTQNCTHKSLFDVPIYSISRQIQWFLHHTSHRFNESLLSTRGLTVSCVPELLVAISMHVNKQNIAHWIHKWMRSEVKGMIEGWELKWANLVHKTGCYLQYFLYACYNMYWLQYLQQIFLGMYIIGTSLLLYTFPGMLPAILVRYWLSIWYYTYYL